MATVAQLLRREDDLHSESARRDTEILLSHVLEKSRTWLYTWPETEIAAEQTLQFEQLLARREAGEPVAYLTGSRDFWSLSLHVNDSTLIPRPETETLVSWALELDLPAEAVALDLGTGSGAIALAVASERPQWRVTAVDASASALDVARANGTANNLQRVQFALSNWYEALEAKKFNLLLSNPPYVDGADPHLQQGDLRFEPRSALVADDQGLADLEQLIEGASAHLCAGGWLLLEHGYEQGSAVRKRMIEAGLCDVATRCDLAGHERVTGGRLHAQ
ncbi:MAG: release factor glutamine methyltransferase [Halioglobus sp.]|jgi:release factor glutamine methyltransferase